MILGIVGSESAKFTQLGENRARGAIHRLIEHYDADLVVSGKCHLGGIDLWAIEEARLLGVRVKEYPPRTRAWSGYKARNIQIARRSDLVICITVDKLPREYKGMRFPLCYHCQSTKHVKSGGCWTAKFAREKLGKEGKIIVVRN